MHFLILGASGRTGQHVVIVSELLSQGHTAVALVRTSGSLTPHPGLTIVTGSPLSKSDIRCRGAEWNFCYGRSEHSWPGAAGEY